MPERDAARATSASATRARSAVPATPDAVPVRPAPVPDGGPAPTPADVAPRALPPSIAPAVQPPAAGATVARPAPSATPAATATPPAAAAPLPVPDARAEARATLAAGRSPSLWWVCTGVTVALLVTFLAGPSPGAAVLAGLLAVSALARAVLRPGPVALTVRSRALDSAMLAALAAGLALLSQLIPTG